MYEAPKPQPKDKAKPHEIVQRERARKEAKDAWLATPAGFKMEPCSYGTTTSRCATPTAKKENRRPICEDCFIKR